MRRPLALLAAVMALTGCTVHEHVAGPSHAEVVVAEPPPPPQPEVKAVRPTPEHVWVDGHWRRYGDRWYWDPGYWDRPPQGHGRWEPGRWKHEARGYVWVEGHWR